MKIKNKLFMLLSTLFFSSAFSITAIPQQQAKQQTSSNPLLIGFAFIVAIIILLIIITIIIVRSIIKKVKDEKRKWNDLVYALFSEWTNICRMSRNRLLKKRNWKFLFLMWKRAKVYVRSETQGLKEIGFYNGESFTKDSAKLLDIYDKKGLFGGLNYILIFPKGTHELIKVEYYNNKPVIVINDCLGVDEWGNTDYFYMPLIINMDEKTKTKKPIIDFSDYIQKEIINKYVYQVIIKEQALRNAETIEKAVEENPYINLGRKKPDN